MSFEFENILQSNSQHINNICNQLTGTFTDIYKKMENEKKCFKKELKSIENRMNEQITSLLELLLEKEKEIKKEIEEDEKAISYNEAINK